LNSNTIVISSKDKTIKLYLLDNLSKKSEPFFYMYKLDNEFASAVSYYDKKGYKYFYMVSLIKRMEILLFIFNIKYYVNQCSET